MKEERAVPYAALIAACLAVSLSGASMAYTVIREESVHHKLWSDMEMLERHLEILTERVCDH